MTSVLSVIAFFALSLFGSQASSQFIDKPLDRTQDLPTKKAQDPASGSMAGENIVRIYSLIVAGLDNYKHVSNKCSPYFKETPLESRLATQADKALTDLKSCYRVKAGRELTDQVVREFRQREEQGGLLETFSMMQRFDMSGVDPRSARDVTLCKEKSVALSLAMLPVQQTTFPTRGWCSTW